MKGSEVLFWVNRVVVPPREGVLETPEWQQAKLEVCTLRIALAFAWACRSVLGADVLENPTHYRKPRSWIARIPAAAGQLASEDLGLRNAC
jgi:hypothetical protein